MSDKIKVAFVCVHNSCRSQMAEAIAKLIAAESFESYSAGTETKPQINQDAVAIIKELYGVDMNAAQKSKLITDIPLVELNALTSIPVKEGKIISKSKYAKKKIINKLIYIFL
jgi:arsenate reductase